MANDYTLPFLSDLPQQFSNNDVEQIWRNRAFPLVLTEDFSSNWRAVPDPNGIFIAPSGAHCRVEPQPHHISACQVMIQEGETCRQVAFSYEAIIFSKVVHRMFLNERPKDCKDPFQVQRRKFINQFVKILPSQWRTLIILADLHSYREHIPLIPWFIKLDIYSTLADPNNIRLITIRPSDDYNARIECTLFEVDRTSEPEYEALSYAWGAPGSTRNILLNDRLIPIRENLEAALRQLRRRDRPRTMWVDGICIDQSNVQERTEQVQQMDKTYRNATGVVVWIGRESNTTARLFDKFNVMLKDFKQLQDLLRRSRHFLDFPFQPEKYCPQCDGVPRDVASQLVRPFVTERAADSYTKAARDTTVTEREWKNVQVEEIEAFLTLLSRPWWKRVWVLQEAILAKSITLYCGSRSIDWPLLQSILYTYVRQGKRSRIHHIGGLTTEARRARAHINLLAAVNSTFAFFFLQSSSIPTDQLQGLSMADLLSLTWNFDATDPRDKIFALISLLPENCPERVLFKPDYTVNVKQLFLHVAKTFLKTSQRLDVLTARSSLPDYLVPVLGREPDHFRFDGPSWVPNWKSLQIWQVNSIWISDFSPFKTLNWYARTRLLEQRPVHESTGPETIPVESLQVFNASLHDTSPFPFEFSEHGEILHIRGLTVDRVEEVGQPWSLGLAARKAYNPANSKESKQNAHDAQVAIIEQWKSIARLDTKTDYTFTGQSRNEAFWRTMFLDRYRSTHTHDRLYRICRIPAQVKENEAIDIFSPGGIICDFPPRTADDELGLVYFLRHEVTEMWAFANVNLHCADLSLFRTAKGYIGVGHPNLQPGDKVTIFLGAPVPLVLREYEEGHLLIGQSYVHGIMDGEFLQAERDHGRGTKQEDFEMFAII